MRVAIVGSRDFGEHTDAAREHVYAIVRALPTGDVVVTGGARGVDTWATDAADARRMSVMIHLADWSKGRGAGYARNALIVADCDRVIAIWDGKSKGTAHTVSLARKAGKPVEVVVIGPQNAEKAPTPARE